jgi:phosphoglycolate phosphatase-like HAD superfamily hydrolase
LELLEILKEHNFKIGVATMRYTHSTVESELQYLHVSKLVQSLLTREDLGIKRPQGAVLDSFEEIVDQRSRLVMRTLKELQSQIDRAFLVGDSWWDTRAGKKIGMTTVLVKTGFSAYNDFSKENPDYIVGSLSDLRTLLENLTWNISSKR